MDQRKANVSCSNCIYNVENNFFLLILGFITHNSEIYTCDVHKSYVRSGDRRTSVEAHCSTVSGPKVVSPFRLVPWGVPAPPRGESERSRARALPPPPASPARPRRWSSAWRRIAITIASSPRWRNSRSRALGSTAPRSLLFLPLQTNNEMEMGEGIKYKYLHFTEVY
jgi:hypothetical protein